MKKITLGVLIGIVFSIGIVCTAEILMDAESVSYTSEYTDKDNVADALSEILGAGDPMDGFEEYYHDSKTLSTNSDITFNLPIKENRDSVYIVFVSTDVEQGVPSQTIPTIEGALSVNLIYNGTVPYVSTGTANIKCIYYVKVEKGTTSIKLKKNYKVWNSSSPQITYHVFVI